MEFVTEQMQISCELDKPILADRLIGVRLTYKAGEKKVTNRILANVISVFIISSIVLVHTNVVYASNLINVSVDGQQISLQDARPQNINGRTLVPIRAVFESIGFVVEWNGDTGTATMTRGSDIVIISVGSATFTTNGITSTLDVPAQIIEGSTMLPIRAVLESVGYDVDWDPVTSTVLISSAQAAVVPESAAVPEGATPHLNGRWLLVPNPQGQVQVNPDARDRSIEFQGDNFVAVTYFRTRIGRSDVLERSISATMITFPWESFHGATGISSVSGNPMREHMQNENLVRVTHTGTFALSEIGNINNITFTFQDGTTHTAFFMYSEGAISMIQMSGGTGGWLYFIRLT